MASYTLASFLLLGALLALCQGAVINGRITDDKNIDDCDVSRANRALLEENIYEPAHFLAFAKRTINFPQSTVSNDVITCIKVTNTDVNNHGGYPRIVSGGVGSTAVQLLLTSQFNQPMSFRLEIWTEY